jgi:hypothetical protein
MLKTPQYRIDRTQNVVFLTSMVATTAWRHPEGP